MTNDTPKQTPDFVPRTQRTSEYTVSIANKTQGLKMPIVLMVWPPLTIGLAIIAYAAVNLAFMQSVSPVSEEGMFGSYGTFQALTNILLFLVGAISVLLGPISFITGLIVLFMRITERNKDIV